MHATAKTFVDRVGGTNEARQDIRVLITTIQPSHEDCSVVTNANLVLHEHHAGMEDAQALLSLEPGLFEVKPGDAAGGGYRTLRVLTGSLRVAKGREWRTVKEGESLSLSPATPLSVRTDRFTQSLLLDWQSATVGGVEEAAANHPWRPPGWAYGVVRPPPPPPPRKPEFPPPVYSVMRRPGR